MTLKEQRKATKMALSEKNHRGKRCQRLRGKPRDNNLLKQRIERAEYKRRNCHSECTEEIIFSDRRVCSFSANVREKAKDVSFGTPSRAPLSHTASLSRKYPDHLRALLSRLPFLLSRFPLPLSPSLFLVQLYTRTWLHMYVHTYTTQLLGFLFFFQFQRLSASDEPRVGFSKRCLLSLTSERLLADPSIFEERR